MLILMRHSKRADQHPELAAKNNIIWPEMNQFLRPYDPPICDFDLPVQMMQEVESLIPDIRITKIVSSPYLRCIQTASVIAKYLNVTNIEIDARIGEDVHGLRGPIKGLKTKALPATLNKNMLPKKWKDATYSSFDAMKGVIMNLMKDQDGGGDQKQSDGDTL